MELLFNPLDFNNEHKPLLLKQYHLTQEQLREYGIRLTQIRKGFIDQAGLCFQPKQLEQQALVMIRSRKGLAHSTKARDLFGHSELEYRQLEREEKYHRGKMKRRNLRQLDADECVAIVDANIK